MRLQHDFAVDSKSPCPDGRGTIRWCRNAVVFSLTNTHGRTVLILYDAPSDVWILIRHQLVGTGAGARTVLGTAATLVAPVPVRYEVGRRNEAGRGGGIAGRGGESPPRAVPPPPPPPQPLGSSRRDPRYHIREPLQSATYRSPGLVKAVGVLSSACASPRSRLSSLVRRPRRPREASKAPPRFTFGRFHSDRKEFPLVLLASLSHL